MSTATLYVVLQLHSSTVRVWLSGIALTSPWVVSERTSFSAWSSYHPYKSCSSRRGEGIPELQENRLRLCQYPQAICQCVCHEERQDPWDEGGLAVTHRLSARLWPLPLPSSKGDVLPPCVSGEAPWIGHYMRIQLTKYEHTSHTVIIVPLTLSPLWLLFLVRLGVYTVNLCVIIIFSQAHRETDRFFAVSFRSSSCWTWPWPVLLPTNDVLLTAQV